MKRASHASTRGEGRVALVLAVLAVAATVGGLVVYKAAGSLGAIAKVADGGTVARRSGVVVAAEHGVWLQPLVGAMNYLSWVIVALVFGVLIGALVRAAIPSRWLVRTFGTGGLRGHAVAAALGTPLMLCSCCIAPVFEGVYSRTRRLGPALALMLAAPTLNPAALALTFLLFPSRVAWARLAIGLLVVLGGSMLIGRMLPPASALASCPLDTPNPRVEGLARAFGAALREVSRRSVPALLVGIVLSAALVGWFPLHAITASSGGAIAMTLVVALIAVPIALPTFAEIPLALALLHAGAPEGAALVMLVAGPAINLPSLLTLRALASGRVAVVVAVAVFVLSAAGALTV